MRSNTFATNALFVARLIGAITYFQIAFNAAFLHGPPYLISIFAPSFVLKVKRDGSVKSNCISLQNRPMKVWSTELPSSLANPVIRTGRYIAGFIPSATCFILRRGYRIPFYRNKALGEYLIQPPTPAMSAFNFNFIPNNADEEFIYFTAFSASVFINRHSKNLLFTQFPFKSL